MFLAQRQLQEAEAKYKAAHAEGRRLLRDEVTADDVAGVVAVWTGIPLTRLKQSEKEKLLNLQDRLHERVVAQDKAVRKATENQQFQQHAIPAYECSAPPRTAGSVSEPGPLPLTQRNCRAADESLSVCPKVVLLIGPAHDALLFIGYLGDFLFC